MSLLGRLGPERRTASLDALLGVFGQRYGNPTNSGQTVTPDSAMQNATVWCAVNLISDMVSTFPWEAWRETDGELQPARPPQILTSPSVVVGSVDWRRQIIVSWLLRGNAYCLVTERDATGRATRMEPIHPDLVQVMRMTPLGPFRFMLMGHEMPLYPLGDLWHAPAYTVPGSPVGLSAIEFGRQAIGLGLAAEEFGARFFGDGAHPTSIISTDSEVTKEQAEVIKERIREALQNRRDPAVLGLGLKWQQVQINPEESQFLETIKANSLTIAKFFGLASAAELIGAESTASMTYANVSQKSLNLLTYGLRPWLRRLEDIYDDLTVRPMRIRAKVDDMLRVDPKTRVDIQSEQIRAGLRTQNELRREDNRPPVDGGDRLLWPPYGTKELVAGEADITAPGAAGGAQPNA